MALAMAMGRIECQADAAIANQIQATMRSLPSGGLVILISDVFEDVEDLLKSFRAVRTTGRSMIVVQVIDPMEFDFPVGDTVEYIGLEGEPACTVDASGIGAAYREEVSKHQRSLEAGCRSAGIPFWILPTNVPLHTKLPEFVNSLGR